MIDVYHKLRCLKLAGVKIHLHCFQYGNKKESPELEQLCETVFYYPRKKGITSFLSLLPYNVKSRTSEKLAQNLLKNDYPILFEVLHTCSLLNDKRFVNRIKLYRQSNIEHIYYWELAKAEKQLLKKIYLATESLKLKWFEPTIKNATVCLAVSTSDVDYFQKKYRALKTEYLPSFHEFDTITSISGKGNYILYHGNLSVSENYLAAKWLINNVFSHIKYPVVIAGLNPPTFIKTLITKYPHITLKENCTEDEMAKLIKKAHIHCLYTQQATGLKLKLLNVLYSGRYVICNNNMTYGTSLHQACTIANTENEYIKSINTLMGQEFEIAYKRIEQLDVYDNKTKTQQILEYLTIN